MAPPIRILCLEDDPADAELMSSTLVRDGVDVAITRVDARESFLDALRTEEFDVVLADYSLPSFDGISALEMLRQQGNKIGFILVSGTLGQETAIEALKAGAHDYVFKDNLTRLAPAVRRVVREVEAETERESVIAALLDSEQRYRDLIDNSGVAIVADDREGRLNLFNSAFCGLFGYRTNELKGRSIWDLIHPDDLAAVRSRHERRYFDDPQSNRWYLFRGLRKDGQIVHLEIHTNARIEDGEVVGTLSFLHDVTAHKQLEQQLAQAQKLEALGQLAGGIAHDFNNLLMSIMGSADLLELESMKEGKTSQELAVIRESVTRGAALTQRLLAIARQQVLEMAVLDVRSVVADELKILRRVIPENISIDFVVPAELPPVMADKGQIGQVLMNLVVNSRDAMPLGGRIDISLTSVRIDQIDAGNRPGVVSGDYVSLAVQDTGVGMDAVTMARVFEPFYSTKKEGKGTGMGLATVYGIVKQHKGFVEIESEQDKGARFEVFLPVTVESMTPKRDLRPPGAQKGYETILVVEDEENVRTTIVEVLKTQGYEVIEAADGNEALEILRNEATVDLVVSDVVMPELGGRDLMCGARELVPDLAFLFSSGYTDEELRDLLATEDRASFIAKPFTIEQLSGAVRHALAGAEER